MDDWVGYWPIAEIHKKGVQSVNKEYLERFDNIVANSEISVAMPHEPARSTPDVNPRSILKYDSNRNYGIDFCQAVLYSPDIDESSKLTFIREALADKDPKYKMFFSTNCRSAVDQPNMAKLLDEHFRKISSDADPNDPYEAYKHFEFIIFNNLIGSNQLIDNYLANRPVKGMRFPYEAVLVSLLVHRDRTENALSIIKMLIQEIEAGESEYISTNIYLDEEHDEDLFVSLYFNVDQTRKSEVVELAFLYGSSVGTKYWTTGMERLLWNTDEERYMQLLARHSRQVNRVVRTFSGSLSQREVLDVFQSNGYLTEKSITEYDDFAGTYLRAEKLIDGTGNTYKSYGDLCEYPVRYDEFYYFYIHPILRKNGLKAPVFEQLNEDSKLPLILEADQIHEKINRLNHSHEDYSDEIGALQQKYKELHKAIGVYTLAITSEITTRYVEIESQSDGYVLRDLFLAINMALADNRCTKRVIQMWNGDPCVWLGVFNPDEFIPLLQDLEIYGFADTFEDGLMQVPGR